MRLSIIIGFFAGIIGVLVLAWTAPFLPHDRVRSQTDVQTNGGRLERFHVDVPGDVLSLLPAGGVTDVAAMPVDARWYPDLAPFSGEAATYRLRDDRGTVIGVASRVRGVADPADVQWVLHIPARGTLALTGASVGNTELGSMAEGDGEFAGLTGEWQATRDAESSRWNLETLVMVPQPREQLQAAGETP